MSKNGFISSLIIEPGNGADAKYLVPLVEKHMEIAEKFLSLYLVMTDTLQ